jgi:hypothetical protein
MNRPKIGKEPAYDRRPGGAAHHRSVTGARFGGMLREGDLSKLGASRTGLESARMQFRCTFSAIEYRSAPVITVRPKARSRSFRHY